MPKFSNDELLGIIEAHRSNSIGALDGDLSAKRAEALKRYLGEPYGDEVEGRSQVISKDLAEAVDWIMPSIMRVFMMTNDFVRFDPTGPEDTEAAEQETDYVNHVMMKENNGFIWLYDWCKDALLSINGYVKRWWDEYEEVSHETYQNTGEEELALLMQDLESFGDGIEIVGQEMSEAGAWKIKVKRTKKVGRVRIEGIPAEELLIAAGTRGNLQESAFVEHITRKTKSKLIEMGMKKSFVDDLPAYADITMYGDESQSRSPTNDEDNTTRAETADPSMTEVEYREAWLRVDYDNDGIAELRRIVTAGNKIPSGDEWNTEVDEIPISYLTPNRMPHRHVGLGLNDEIEQLAGMKTSLLRSTFDNTYHLVHQEYAINERAELDDFLISRPNGLKRIKGREPIDGSVMPLVKTPIIQHVMPILDYVDGMKESRTGVGKSVIGLDPDTLKKTTEGAARQALQQGNAKIEMIARLFAETGIKDLALAVHALLIKYQDKEKKVRLRNKWVTVRPSEWRSRTDMTVNVGLGAGSHEEIRANLMLMAELQTQFKQDGIVIPKNTYNLAEKLSDQLGFKEQGLFFTDPNGQEMAAFKATLPPPPPDPLIVMEQIKAQSKQQTETMRSILEKEKNDTHHMHEMHQLAFDRWQFQQEQALAVEKERIDALLKGIEMKQAEADAGETTQETEAMPMDEGPSEMQQGFAALAQQVQQQQIMLQQLLETIARPRKITLNRGKDGRATDAVSMLQ